MCESCAYGFFKSITSGSSTKTDFCTAVQNVTCPPGKYINVTVIAEPQCESCAPGFFKDTTSSTGTRNDSCTAYTKCPAGKYSSTSGNATAEPKCNVCAAGFFSACVRDAPNAGRPRHHREYLHVILKVVRVGTIILLPIYYMQVVPIVVALRTPSARLASTPS